MNFTAGTRKRRRRHPSPQEKVDHTNRRHKSHLPATATTSPSSGHRCHGAAPTCTRPRKIHRLARQTNVRKRDESTEIIRKQGGQAHLSRRRWRPGPGRASLLPTLRRDGQLPRHHRQRREAAQYSTSAACRSSRELFRRGAEGEREVAPRADGTTGDASRGENDGIDDPASLQSGQLNSP
jgi:hypothetical protein